MSALLKSILPAMLFFSYFGLCHASVVDGNRIMDQPMAENLCALTFDDGPTPFTPHLLDLLKEYDVPATFFLLGKNASTYPAVVRRMLAEGHEVGNHTWSHLNLSRLSREGQKKEIESADALLRSLGAGPLYMRPPYGSFDDRTVSILDELGVTLMMWSMDSRDWKHLPSDYGKVLSTRGTVYEDGSLRGIFLFHDTHKTTVDDLPRIIANLRAGGCDKFVTVSEYLQGILDPEPPMLMSRREPLPKAHDPGYAVTSGPAPLARCSLPFNSALKNLDDAQAAVAAPETVH